MKSILRSISVGGMFLVLIVAAPASVDMVTVAITGEVTLSDFDTIGVPSAVTGYYRYDDATPDSDPRDAYGLYEGVTFSLTFADDSTISSDEAYISVFNMAGWDAFSVCFKTFGLHYESGDPSPNTLTGSFAGLEPYLSTNFLRHDDDGGTWDSVALPDPELVRSLPNEQNLLHLVAPQDSGSGYDDWYGLEFEVTDLSVVPVPGALALASLGLASAGWRLRRRHGSA